VSTGERPNRPGWVTPPITVRPPYRGDETLGWLADRVVPGVEEASAASYARTLRLPGGAAIVRLHPTEAGVDATFRLDAPEDLESAVRRVRQLFDLDAEPDVYTETLRADEVLRPLVDAVSGLRVPGTVDPEETAFRAVLGQQISIAGARTITGRIVQTFGTPLEDPEGGLTHLFPSAVALARADLAGFGFPGSRGETVRELARRLASGTLILEGIDPEEARRRLLEIRGIGAWTASYISLRALGDRDAFPASDLGILRAARVLGLPSDPMSLEARSERWRPWRAYTAQYLWAADANGFGA
jgi:AraC family transcriptional regulator of adaptative response / DNA-3-methyladenine glycosylase II